MSDFLLKLFKNFILKVLSYESGRNPCLRHEKCINLYGSYKCEPGLIECDQGYIRTSDGKHCTGIKFIFKTLSLEILHIYNDQTLRPGRMRHGISHVWSKWKMRKS